MKGARMLIFGFACAFIGIIIDDCLDDCGVPSAPSAPSAPSGCARSSRQAVPACPPCSPEPCAQHEVGDDTVPPKDTGWTPEVPDAR